MTLENSSGDNRLTVSEMRRQFNEIIVPQLKQGQLVSRVHWERHPSRPKAQEPHCTRSQIVAYYDAKGMEVARAHQYLRPDGTLGASGKPDPNRMVVNGVIYRLTKEPS